MSTLATLPVEDIDAHPRNVRREVKDLEEIAASIKAVGILQPLTVAPQDGRYVLIAGHRRLAAAQKAGLTEVPAVIREDLANDLAKQLQAQLVENLQRTDLTVMEEADAYAQLELLGVKEAAIAKTTGRSKTTVHQRLLLAGLPTKRREQYEAGSISLDGAVMCAKLLAQYADDAEIVALINDAGTWAFSNNYGVKQKIARVLDDRKRAAEPTPVPVADEDDDEDMPGQSTVDDQIRESAWSVRQKAGKAAQERFYDWLSGRVVAQDAGVLSKALDLAIDFQVRDYDVERLLPLFGVEPCGEDEDVDDANHRITASLKALDSDDRAMFLAIASADVLSGYVYGTWDERLSDWQQLGYPLTGDDRALLGEDGE